MKLGAQGISRQPEEYQRSTTQRLHHQLGPIGHGQVVIQHRPDRRTHHTGEGEYGQQPLAAVGGFMDDEQQAEADQHQDQRRPLAYSHGH